jgi:hypothetical protein
MRTASPPYDRHVGEVNDLLDAGASRSEITAAVAETELYAEQKAALCLLMSRLDDPPAGASEEAQRETAIAEAKGRALARLALDGRERRRRPRRADGFRYGDAQKYGESGELVQPQRQPLLARVRRLLNP